MSNGKLLTQIKPLAHEVKVIIVGKAKWKSLKLLLIPDKIGNHKHLARMREVELIGGHHDFSINFASLSFEETGII